MQVTSFEFLIFFLAVAVVNFLLPKKFRMYWLLASSYYFYMRLAPVYALFLVFSTIVTYAAGILIEKNSDAKVGAAGNNSTVSGIKSITLTAGTACKGSSVDGTRQNKSTSGAAGNNSSVDGTRQNKSTSDAAGNGSSVDGTGQNKSTSGAACNGSAALSSRRLILILCLVINLALLAVCKYSVSVVSIFPNSQAFIDSTLSRLIVPVGISFYMLQALGYVIDVYRGTIAAERNLARYALFVSFFPEIMSGPIERAGHMLPQFAAPESFDYENMRHGLLRMIWGFFLKLVLADRMAIVVNTVYSSPTDHAGGVVVLATILYTFEIYCDFAGYSEIAIGTAQVLGYEVRENFDCPYLSSSIADFWRRWHQSLSYWFRDYVYIPLGGNRRGQARKYLNIMIVFIVSGIWHGAGITFIVWGALHGLYQVIGHMLQPVRSALVRVFHVKTSAFSHRFLRVLVTFCLVSFAWIFFRADSLGMAAEIIRNMRGFTPWELLDGTLYKLGLSAASFNLMVAGLLLLILVDILKFRGVRISDVICRQGLWLRWTIYIAAIALILVCGIWGSGYSASNFIYYQF